METRVLRSLRKSLANCKKGAWDSLSKEDIHALVLYQEDQFIMNEEGLTEKESRIFIALFRDLLFEVEKNTNIKVESKYMKNLAI